jgi:hypothetical protein
MVMAKIYAKCGEYDKAFDKLDELLSLRTVYTVNDIKHAQEFVPLRDLPRYQQLMQKYSGDFSI